jgi:DUF1680 family protein
MLIQKNSFICASSFLAMLFMCGSIANAQKPAFTYNEAKEVAAAEMGVERVALNYMPGYISKAESDDVTKWVQIDLGSRQLIDCIKLLPAANGWGDITGGFPQKFYIAVSDDPEFKTYVVYQDCTDGGTIEFPGLKVVTFNTRSAEARYVRLTATKLRDHKLTFTKIKVMSNGKEISTNCKVTGSDPANDKNLELLTRPDRPMGEYVVTDHPENVIPESQWNRVENVIETPLGGVSMHDGLIKHVMDNNIHYLLHSFTFDDLVRNFRLKAGIPVEPFNPNFPVFWMHQLPGSEAGRFLMSAGNTLRWTEDADLRKEMNDIVDVIDQCKEPDGYCMAYPKHTIFVGERGGYTRSWVSQGLIEAGYAGNEKAFQLLRGFYDWFDQCPFLPEMMRRCAQGIQGMIPITRTYFTPVGKPEEIKTAMRYYQENWWMDALAARDTNAIWKYPYDRPHNYLVTTLEAYMDLYLATGAEKYLNAMLGAWGLFHDNWEMTGGSLAINEGPFLYAPKSYYLHRECGELCGNVFWTRFNQRFHHIYPDEEKYVSEMEKSIYNVIIANQVGNEGIRYFARQDGYKDGTPQFHSHGISENTCCEGQGSRAYGTLPEYLYSIAEDGIYIDMFAGSDFACQVGGRNFGISTDTQFPYDGNVEITITDADADHAKIHLRVPDWAKGGIVVKINGKKAGKGKPGTYMTLSRKWAAGDRISFTLPMPIRLTPYNGIEEGFDSANCCMEYGPIMMAAVRTSGGEEKIELPYKAGEIASKLVPIEGKPLHFKVKGVEGIEYWPYFEVMSEYFTCYPKFKK